MVYKWALPAYPDAVLFNVLNSGHKPLDKLRKLGVLSGFVQDFVNQVPISADRFQAPDGSTARKVDDAVVAYN